MVRQVSRYRRDGFTLVELVIVIALVTMLLLLAMPFARSWVNSNRQIQARSQLWEGVAQARALAMRNPRGLPVTRPVAILRFGTDSSGGKLTVTTGNDILVWSADLPAGVIMKEVGAFQLPDASALDNGSFPEFHCMAFNSHGQRLVKAPTCRNDAKMSQRIAIGYASLSPLHVQIL